jgi:ABC-type multidrug transport system ATPase subunit
MSLLELKHVYKSYGRPPHDSVALKDVSLELDAGELAMAWGQRRSGRSTLLRVAAGVASPDEGVVRFCGEDLTGRASAPARARIAYCGTLPVSTGPQTILDELLEEPLACGIEPLPASRRIRAALERTGAEQCSRLRASELDPAGRVRVTLARALLRSPKLIVIDEPALGVSFRQRDEIIALLRSFADEGVAVLCSTDSSTGFLGADRSLMLDRGHLRGEVAPELAEVLPLRRPA